VKNLFYIILICSIVLEPFSLIREFDVLVEELSCLLCYMPTRIYCFFVTSSVAAGWCYKLYIEIYVSVI